MALLGPPQVFRREVFITPSSVCRFKIPAVKAAVQWAELDLRGWPVLNLRHETMDSNDRAVWFKSPDREGRAFLYWMIGLDGLVAQVSMCSEEWARDPEVKQLFDPVIRIFEMTETLAVFLRMYQKLEVEPSVQLRFQFTWPSAKGRLIAHHGNWLSISRAEGSDRRVPLSKPGCELVVPAGTTSEQIPSLIIAPFRDLLSSVTDDLKDLEDATIIDWSARVLTRQPLR